jgi:predicted nucleotidyltransferase
MKMLWRVLSWPGRTMEKLFAWFDRVTAKK